MEEYTSTEKTVNHELFPSQHNKLITLLLFQALI